MSASLVINIGILLHGAWDFHVELHVTINIDFRVF